MTIKHRYGSGVGLISDRAAGAAARNDLTHDFTPAYTVFVCASRQTLHQSSFGRYWPLAGIAKCTANVCAPAARRRSDRVIAADVGYWHRTCPLLGVLRTLGAGLVNYASKIGHFSNCLLPRKWRWEAHGKQL